LSRRYDARFYLARLPSGQTVQPEPGEVTDWLWVTPERALRDPAITLVYATKKVLESVNADEDATSLINRTRRLKNAPVVEPRMTRTESGWEISH
jgi:hypothetical protein